MIPRTEQPVMKFADLGLSPETLQAIEEVGYDTPTPIQEKAIPSVLMGRDVLGIAQTGTGKTAGFTLPMIEILSNGRAKARMPRSLILAPTRELAAQVAENFSLYGKYHKLDMALLIGGESMGEQMRALDKGVDVLIATPGRLLDLFERGKILLRDVKVLVIDEADRMLDMGFIPDVERIITLLPPLRQTLFFSATMDKDIRKLADAFLSNPREISIERKATAAETVTQRLAIVPRIDKREALRHILRTEGVRNAFIFCNRKRDVDVLNRSLRKHDFNCISLHGDMDQPTRNEMLRRFKDGEADLLVCSDVAARGLDIDDVSHVINFDIPTHPEDYVHRIGRTGRAGKEGAAFSLATPDDAKLLTAIESMLGRAIPRMTLEGLEAPVLDGGETRADSGRRGGRDRDRRGSRDRRSSRERPEAGVEETREAVESRDRGDRPDRAGRARRGRRRDDVPAMSHADDVLGFGDHMPAFFADNALGPMGRGGDDTGGDGDEDEETTQSRRKGRDKDRKGTAKTRARSSKGKDSEADQETPRTRKRHGRRGAPPEDEPKETSEGTPAGDTVVKTPEDSDVSAAESAESDAAAPAPKPRRATRRRKSTRKSEEVASEEAGPGEAGPIDASASDVPPPDTEAPPKRRARRVRRPKTETPETPDSSDDSSGDPPAEATPVATDTAEASPAADTEPLLSEEESPRPGPVDAPATGSDPQGPDSQGNDRASDDSETGERAAVSQDTSSVDERHVGDAIEVPLPAEAAAAPDPDSPPEDSEVPESANGEPTLDNDGTARTAPDSTEANANAPVPQASLNAAAPDDPAPDPHVQPHPAG